MAMNGVPGKRTVYNTEIGNGGGKEDWPMELCEIDLKIIGHDHLRSVDN